MENSKFICTDNCYDDYYHYYYLFYVRCGEHLRGLFSSPIVQHFLCGVPFSELLKENSIYQPGCLRKVCLNCGEYCFYFLQLSHGTTTCKLCDVSTHAYYDKNGTLLRDVFRICQLHNLPESASLLSPFLKYNAVVSANGLLVNVGDFIKVSSTSPLKVSIICVRIIMSFHQITTGIILACGILDKKFEICIVRELEPQINISNGSPLVTEFDCPILLLTNNIFVVSPLCIHSPISVFHICLHSCLLSSDSLNFIHDFSNSLFCYNIYCISNN